MQPAYDKIARNPRFAELVSKRNRFAITLSIIVLAVFAAFGALAVATPGLFSASIGSGSPWTIGLIAGWLIQIFAFLITGVYTVRANGEFDTIIRDVIEESRT